MEQVHKEISTEGVIPPIEEKRVKTTVNLKQTHVEELNKIAIAKGLTQTAIIDEAISAALSEFNDTTVIDKMLVDTNGFLFNRDVEQVKKLLPVEMAKKFSPSQIAYLYLNSKDSTDRQRLFNALSLANAHDEINETNRWLEVSSKFENGRFMGYNFSTLVNQPKAKLTPLQKEYLLRKIGQKAFEAMKEYRQDIFIEKSVFATQTPQPQVEVEESETSALGSLME